MTSVEGATSPAERIESVQHKERTDKSFIEARDLLFDSMLSLGGSLDCPNFLMVIGTHGDEENQQVIIMDNYLNDWQRQEMLVEGQHILFRNATVDRASELDPDKEPSAVEQAMQLVDTETVTEYTDGK